MKTAVYLMTSLAVLLSPFIASAENDCEYQKPLGFTVSADKLTTLDLNAGAGKLKVQGLGQATQVQVIATACASSQGRLDDLQIEQRVMDRRLVLNTRQPDSGWSFGINNYAYIDLEITLPEGLAVELTDGSGAVSISQVASAVIDDGSGELEVAQVSGPVSIEDGSGSIRLANIGGPISITDGSGGIEIINADGDVVIDEDGSGGIEIRRAAGNVTIEEDGSGSIIISEVGGDVHIGEDGSGAIEIADVTGSFTVDRNSNGGIRHKNVDGPVSVPEGGKKRY